MEIQGVEITHPDKIMFPDDGITKLQVVQYYAQIAPQMLPFLNNRPVSMVRSPHGVGGITFYQKHPAETFPEYIERVTIKEKTQEKDIYITLDQPNDLVYLANYGVLEFHTWLASLPDLEHPDQLILDLDPDAATNWENVTNAALVLKSRLEAEGLIPKLKVTGGKGLHVWAELPHKKYTWKKSKDLAKSWAQELADEEPHKYTVNPRKEERKGKVFIDYLRNERGATAVCAYSLRARPGASFAKPVEWSELSGNLRPNQARLDSVLVK